MPTPLMQCILLVLNYNVDRNTIIPLKRNQQHFPAYLKSHKVLANMKI